MIWERFETECKSCICNGRNIVCKDTCNVEKPKAGVCPVIEEPLVIDDNNTDVSNMTCTDACEDDLSCDGNMKCCDSGCGKGCVMPSGKEFISRLALVIRMSMPFNRQHMYHMD